MRILQLLLLVFLSHIVCGQDPRLAQQYFSEGEFEKAADLYLKLHETSNDNDYFFGQYYECLIQLQNWNKAELALKKEIKTSKHACSYSVLLGFLYEKLEKNDEAEEQYKKAIEKLPKDAYIITKVGTNFTNNSKIDWAIQCYEKGEKLIADANYFAFPLADLYNRKGDSPKMISYYLKTLVKGNSQMAENLKIYFQRFLKPEDIGELQSQLYTLAQEDPENADISELLSWTFLQKRDYKNAMRHLKAVDRQRNELGQRVFNLGSIAMNEKDLKAAIEAFSYIVDTKGPSSPLYVESKRLIMDCKKKMVTEDYKYSTKELRDLEGEYELFLNEFGYNAQTVPLIQELADLEAYYILDLPKAIRLLDSCKNFSAMGKQRLASVKLSLGDYYLMSGERWEASLLYSQVDKDHQEEIQGQDARFRNARLSYFFGDFEWAQSQFDILKASTSKFIANDALDLSIFIFENSGTDSLLTPLQLFADAELAVFQNRFQDAFTLLDTLLVQYPKHELEDDTDYLKAQIYKKMQNYEAAARMLQLVLDKYSTEIKADNALFELAQLYEFQLNDLEKAKSMYEKLFMDYSGSTFSVEARLRFRILRGDKIQS